MRAAAKNSPTTQKRALGTYTARGRVLFRFFRYLYVSSSEAEGSDPPRKNRFACVLAVFLGLVAIFPLAVSFLGGWYSESSTCAPWVAFWINPVRGVEVSKSLTPPGLVRFRLFSRNCCRYLRFLADGIRVLGPRLLAFFSGLVCLEYFSLFFDGIRGQARGREPT